MTGDAQEDELDGSPFAEGGYDSEEDDFDYEQFVQSEFGSGSSNKHSIWYYVAWLMILVLLLPFVVSLIQ